MPDSFSPQQQTLYRSGAFAGRVDPWAEAARYFRPIHAGMIGALLDMLQVPLMQRGYVAGRETSLQIAAGREPDIYVRREDRPVPHNPGWNYEVAAAEVLAEAGTLVAAADDLDALHIRDAQSGDLVTVVEIVSPGNKTRDHEISAYRERRSRLLLENHVNVVEVDPTRSVKRLTENRVTQQSAYHVAIFLPGDAVRVIEIAFEQALSRIALPLREDVVPVEVQQAYERAYQQTMTAWHIQHEDNYTPEHLPFPSTLTDSQRRTALEAVANWQKRVAE